MLLCRVDQLRMSVSLSVRAHRRTIMSYVCGLCTNASSKVKGGGILAGVDAMVRVSNFRNQDVQGSKFCVFFGPVKLSTIPAAFPDCLHLTSLRPHLLATEPSLTLRTHTPPTTKLPLFHRLHPLDTSILSIPILIHSRISHLSIQLVSNYKFNNVVWCSSSTWRSSTSTTSSPSSSPWRWRRKRTPLARPRCRRSRYNPLPLCSPSPSLSPKFTVTSSSFHQRFLEVL